jgi:hypothetical protein
MDEVWQCEVCRSLNRLGMAECYSCGTPRRIPPIPGARVYESVPASANPITRTASTPQPAEPQPPNAQETGPSGPVERPEPR